MLQATGVILAGGLSLRMGSEKATLKIGQQVMIHRIANELKKVFPEVIIAGNIQEDVDNYIGIPVVPDRIDRGVPICGIHAALYAASYPHILVVACDMPFVTSQMAEQMVQLSSGFDVVVPRKGPYLEPLFAVYHRNCIPAIEKWLSGGKRKTDGFFQYVKVNYIDEDIFVNIDWDVDFFNVNTPGDLHKARKMAETKFGN
jgi:molybdopterin-guanine dinucleotide biosynthesis protein A